MPAQESLQELRAGVAVLARILMRRCRVADLQYISRRASAPMIEFDMREDQVCVKLSKHGPAAL